MSINFYSKHYFDFDFFQIPPAFQTGHVHLVALVFANVAAAVGFRRSPS